MADQSTLVVVAELETGRDRRGGPRRPLHRRARPSRRSFTESNKFCGTDCHEMWPYRDTWAISTHKTANCVQCHIPPGPVNFLKTKLAASREIWVHFTGQVKAPILVTRHIPNSACERSGCHTSAQTSKTLTLGTPAPVDVQARQRRPHQAAVHRLPRSLVHAGAPGVSPLRRRTRCRRASCATRTAPRTAATATRLRTPTAGHA